MLNSISSSFILVPKNFFKVDPASIQVVEAPLNQNLKIIKLNKNMVITAINISQLVKPVTEYKVFAQKQADTVESCVEIDKYEYLPTVNNLLFLYLDNHL